MELEPPLPSLIDLRNQFPGKFRFRERQAQYPYWCDGAFVHENDGGILRTFAEEVFQSADIVLTTIVDGQEGKFTPKRQIVNLSPEKQHILEELKECTTWAGKVGHTNPSRVYIKPVLEGETCLFRTFATRDLPENSFVCHVGGMMKHLKIEEVIERLENPLTNLLTVQLDYTQLDPYYVFQHVQDEERRKVLGPANPDYPLVIEAYAKNGTDLSLISPSTFLKYARTEEESNVVLEYVQNQKFRMNIDQKTFFYFKSTRPIRCEEEILVKPDPEIRQKIAAAKFPTPPKAKGISQFRKPASKPRRHREVTPLESVESPMVLRSGKTKRNQEGREAKSLETDSEGEEVDEVAIDSPEKDLERDLKRLRMKTPTPEPDQAPVPSPPARRGRGKTPSPEPEYVPLVSSDESDASADSLAGHISLATLPPGPIVSPGEDQIEADRVRRPMLEIPDEVGNLYTYVHDPPLWLDTDLDFVFRDLFGPARKRATFHPPLKLGAPPPPQPITSSPVERNELPESTELLPVRHPYTRNVARNTDPTNPSSTPPHQMEVDEWRKKLLHEARYPTVPAVSGSFRRLLTVIFNKGDSIAQKEADHIDDPLDLSRRFPRIRPRGVPQNTKITPRNFPDFLFRLPRYYHRFLETEIPNLARMEEISFSFLMYKEAEIALYNEPIFLSLGCGLESSRQVEKFNVTGFIIIDTKLHLSPNKVTALMKTLGYTDRVEHQLLQNLFREGQRRRAQGNKNLARELAYLEQYLIEFHGSQVVHVLKDPTLDELEDALCDLRNMTDKLVNYCASAGMFVPMIVHLSSYAEWDVFLNGATEFINFMSPVNFHFGAHETSAQNCFPLIMWCGNLGIHNPPEKDDDFPEIFMLSPVPKNSKSTIKQNLGTLFDFGKMIEIDQKDPSTREGTCDLVKLGLDMLHVQQYKHALSKSRDDQHPKPCMSCSSDSTDLVVEVDKNAYNLGEVIDALGSCAAIHLAGTSDATFLANYGLMAAEAQKMVNLFRAYQVEEHVLVHDKEHLFEAMRSTAAVVRQKKSKTFLLIVSSSDGTDMAVKLGDVPFVIEYATIFSFIHQEMPSVKKIICFPCHGQGYFVPRSVHQCNKPGLPSISTADAMKSIITPCSFGSFSCVLDDTVCPWYKVATCLQGCQRRLPHGGVTADEIIIFGNMVAQVMKTQYGDQKHCIFEFIDGAYQPRTEKGKYLSTPFVSTSIYLRSKEPKMSAAPIKKMPQIRLAIAPLLVESPTSGLMKPAPTDVKYVWDTEVEILRQICAGVKFQIPRFQTGGDVRVIYPPKLPGQINLMFSRFPKVLSLQRGANVEVSTFYLKQMLASNFVYPEIVRAYFGLIVRRNSLDTKLPQVAAFSDQITQTLIHPSVSINLEFYENIAPQMDVLQNANSIALFPVCNKSKETWELIVYHSKERTLTYYTPKKNQPLKPEVVHTIIQILNFGLRIAKRAHGGTHVDLNEQNVVLPKSKFQSSKKIEDGVFVCQCAEQLARGLEAHVTSANMESYKYITIAEIILDNLLPRK